MDTGDTFEVERNGYQFEIKYCVRGGLHAGDPDTYYFKATMKDGDGVGRANFYFWRTKTRVAKLAVKRALKDHREKQEPSTAEKLKRRLST